MTRSCISIPSFVVLLMLAWPLSCRRDYCTVIGSDTEVFAEIADRQRGVGYLPRGRSFLTLHPGDVAKIEWTADSKDQLVYQIQLPDGRKGFIFHGELGRFGLPVHCGELHDLETVKRHLPAH